MPYVAALDGMNTWDVSQPITMQNDIPRLLTQLYEVLYLLGHRI